MQQHECVKWEKVEHKGWKVDCNIVNQSNRLEKVPGVLHTCSAHVFCAGVGIKNTHTSELSNKFTVFCKTVKIHFHW